ncbi:MAG: hypothetical protein JSW50_03940 [Candidatus Latescibacterota bacterium]|nr:MAG: hypothetical protein JSW50_03940 [Candidatus Latescibacterota bacterium]
MIYRLAADIGIWLVIWFGVWRLFYGPLATRRINYVDRTLWTSLYFISAAGLVVWFFKNKLVPFAISLTPAHFVVLTLTVLSQILLYRLAHGRFARPVQLIADNPREMFLTLDYRYLVSKSFEVLFQQVMVVLIVAMVWERTGTLPGTMIAFALVFAIGHLPMVRLFGEQNRLFASIYLVAALTSAVVFPVVILKVDGGFVYTYAMHSLFFTLLAMWFWRGNSRRSKS